MTRFSLCHLLLLALLPLFAPITAQAGNGALLSKYAEIRTELNSNPYGMPVYIYSSDQDHRMLGEVYGIIDYPYQTIRTALATPNNWCEIVPQHLNIKACTYQHQNGFCHLTFYTGRKYYEKADDVYQLAYRFVLSEEQQDYFHADLSAADGPMGTSEYNIQVEAIPLTDSTSFVHFQYSYTYNFITQLGMNTYLATLGRDKVGFSVLDNDVQGMPVLVEGVRGIIERNAIRYYLAIQSYLDTLQVESENRFNARIGRWFELTESHPRQLHEMDKKEYVKYKQDEYADQQRLQKAIHDNGDQQQMCGTALSVNK